MNLPKHIAVIPDGNRRWAREKGLPTFEGHKKGFEVAVQIVESAWNLGVHTLTLWAFSTENWKRSKQEVAYLMKLYERMVNKYLKKAHKHKVRIVHLGRKDRIPPSLKNKILQAERETQRYQDHILNIALDYGGRDEIVRAINKLRANSKFKIQNSKLTEEEFAQYLDTAGQPYPQPDLIIRTSGEQRLSGFMSWQSAYSELYFEPCYFPDFTPKKLKRAIKEYSKRQRRFGK